MKYFTEEVFQQIQDDIYNTEAWDKALAAYLKEYNEITRERLPKKFVEIYEKNHKFDDAFVPHIRVFTEYHGFTKGVGKRRPSKLELVIVDRDDFNLAWQIVIDKIKDFEFCYKSYYEEQHDADIDDYVYDELLVIDNKYISWEIIFGDGFQLWTVFEKIHIKKLPLEELDVYKNRIKM